MLEQGGSPEDIPLPKAEPIPQQHWPLASAWIGVYGRDLVACLFSRNIIVCIKHKADSNIKK